MIKALRWQGGDMIQRWAVAAILRAERKFKRIKGYKEIPKLITALVQKNIDPVRNFLSSLYICKSKFVKYFAD